MASLADRITAPTEEKKVEWSEESDQLDGATEMNNGSMMAEPEFDVEVKLIDETSPLHSIRSFEELGLFVPSIAVFVHC